MYKIQKNSKIILADHIFLVWFQYMLSIGVINMDINIAVELCKNDMQMLWIRKSVSICFLLPWELFIVFSRRSKWGELFRVKLKNVMLSHYIITTPWMTGCLLVWPYVISLPLGQRINGHEEVGGLAGGDALAPCHSKPMLVFLNDVCHQSWMPVSVPASSPLCWRVSPIKQELHEDGEQRSSEWSFCYNISAVCAKKHSLLIAVKCIVTCAPAWENHTRFKNSSTLPRTERFTWRRWA